MLLATAPGIRHGRVEQLAGERMSAETPSGREQTSGRRTPGTRKTFGTFAGVFTPTLLTILGVIMYLRLGWVAGNAGLLGGLLILVLALGITAATGLSLASIATNTRLGAGGPYAIVSGSLGLEVGGSIGVPLYLSQAVAVAMYIFGLREGWVWIFPEHPALLVDLAAFAVIFSIAFVSADLAFRIQYVVIGIIAVSLVAILGNVDVWQNPAPFELWGGFQGSPEDGFSGTTFWTVFAVFFPAATGIMAGANMSGELTNPRRSIPVGTIAAIALSAVIYLVLLLWVVAAAPPDELRSNYTIMIDRSLWGPAVLAGLLGATFSSALSSLVGAPRILLALGRDRLLPGLDYFSRASSGGEPRRGMLLTGAIVLLALMLRDLNVIAPLITMFFLITYATINLVVLIESRLGLISFRPTLRIPAIVPLIGTAGCGFAMFVVNPTFGMVAVAVVIGMFAWITRRGVGRGREDVRSGMFVAIASWAAAKVKQLDIKAVRSWKPSLLVPVEDTTVLRGEYRALLDLTRPEGEVKLLGLARKESVDRVERDMEDLGRGLQQEGVFTTWSVVDCATFRTGLFAGMQALRSAFFCPNILFLSMPEESRDEETYAVLEEFGRLHVGTLLWSVHPQARMGKGRVLNLWLPPSDPTRPMAESLRECRMNLGALTAYRIARVWSAELNLISVVDREDDVDDARAFLQEFKDLCRFPEPSQIQVMVGELDRWVGEGPQSDLDVMGLPRHDGLAFARRMLAVSRSSCVFAVDSGAESAVA